MNLASVALVLALLPAGGLTARQPKTLSSTSSPSVTPDRLELGLQGQSLPSDNPGSVLEVPFSKGVNVLGHEPLKGRDSNLQLAWSGHCAYVSSTTPKFLNWGASASPETFGVAVVNVADPRSPRQVGLLRGKASLYASETLHAVSVRGRSVLVAGSYGAKDDAAFTDIYDISDCEHPLLTSTIKWPKSVHTLTLSPNGKRLYGTVISPFTGNGGIAAFDISDLAAPRSLGLFEATRADGTSFPFSPHEVSISPDERRIFAGVTSSQGGDLNKGIKLGPNRAALGPDGGGIYILDNSDLAAGRRNPRMRLISAVPGGGWHSVMPARIKGVPHLVGAAELLSCPGVWPKFTNIRDERAPFIGGEFRLAMNKPENCSPPTAMEKATGGLVVSPGTATLHFNDVDSATDTRLGLFNYLWAGLRMVDIRRPAAPREVAYFKPGDACGGHVRYLPKTGQIWLACQASGFWVLELKPETRAAIGRPRLR